MDGLASVGEICGEAVGTSAGIGGAAAMAAIRSRRPRTSRGHMRCPPDHLRAPAEDPLVWRRSVRSSGRFSTTQHPGGFRFNGEEDPTGGPHPALSAQAGWRPGSEKERGRENGRARSVREGADEAGPSVGALGHRTSGLLGMNVLVGQKENLQPGKFFFSFSIMFYFLFFYS